jgi:lipopolysaccharide/colanic/teichoic acid biosynthesis glycosyltransferase
VVWLGAQLRSTDVIGSLGDGSYGVLLAYTTATQADVVCRRLRDLFAQARNGAPPAEISVRQTPATDEAVLREELRGSRQRQLAEVTDPTDRRRTRCDPAGVIAFLARPLPLWKRAMDLVLGSAGVLVAMPAMLAISIAVRLTSRGPVIYRQERTGHALQRFEIYKFRTMRIGSDRELEKVRHLNEMSGPLFRASADPRLTPIGAFLRRTSLDELPQLFNVLRGDMTLVGPRALSPLPSEYEGWQLHRFIVKPGIACTWQASRRSDTDFDEWMRSDLEYVARPESVLGDLRLLCSVLASVVRFSGGK